MILVLSHKANHEYTSLPIQEQRKIKRKLAGLAKDPYLGKKLNGELTGWRSVRAWPYRILYSLDKNQVMVHKIQHRQGVYKN